MLREGVHQSFLQQMRSASIFVPDLGMEHAPGGNVRIVIVDGERKYRFRAGRTAIVPVLRHGVRDSHFFEDLAAPRHRMVAPRHRMVAEREEIARQLMRKIDADIVSSACLNCHHPFPFQNYKTKNINK